MTGRGTITGGAHRAVLIRAAAIAAAAVLAAGCGDAGPSGTAVPAASDRDAAATASSMPGATSPAPATSGVPTPTPAPIVHTLHVEPDGGGLTVPATDPLIAGWRLDVPAGALASATDLTATAIPPAGTAAALAEAEPALFLALGDAVTAALPEGSVSPIFGPVRALLGATQAGPTLELGPSGTRFAAPADLVIPASAVADVGDGVHLAAIRDAGGGWEVVVPEVRADGLHVPISHFSGLRMFDIAGRVLANPGARVDRGLVLAAREKLESAPLADAERAILSATACDGAGAVTLDTSKLPTSLTMVLNYLGRDSGSIAQGRSGDEVVEAMNGYLQARLAAVEKVTKPRDPARTHFVTMEDLYREALRQTGNDAFQALLAVHGVLRDNRRQAGQAANPWLESIEVLRGDGGDEDGARYHFVGAAIYAFVYAHQAEAKTLSFLNLAPEDVVRLEEAWVSGDIESDVTEYAVDLAGIRFGRRLYDHFRALSAGEDSRLTVQVCTTMEGTVDLATMATTAKDRALIAKLVTENTVWLTFEPVADDPDVQARVTGEIVISLRMPPELMYAIHTGVGQEVFGIDAPPMPDAWLDCSATMTVRIELTGTQARAGKHDVTGRANAQSHGDLASGCDDTGADLKVGEASPQKGLAWTATGSPTSMKGRIRGYAEGADLRFTVKAALPAW